MRALFAGSPALAVPSLVRTAACCHVVGVLTCCDKPVGRGGGLEASPVKRKAAELGLKLLQPERLDAAAIEQVRGLSPDLLVVAAFGRIFSREFLSLFPCGGINVHPSLLPRHRGPSPVSAAILAGDTETGVTIQSIAQKFDTGDILAQRVVTLGGKETTGTLTDSLAVVGAELLGEVLGGLSPGGLPVGRPQDESLATYCRIIGKEDGRIDWSRPAAVIERSVRAFDPWPRAGTTWRDSSLLLLKTSVHPGTFAGAGEPGAEQPGTVLAVDRQRGLLVRTGEGILAVERLQLQFKKPLDWRAFLNGHPDFVGSRLGG
jgi:methionyl-tRNA formyltransferase